MTMTLPMTAPMLPPVAPALSETAKDIRDRARHLAWGCKAPTFYGDLQADLRRGVDDLLGRLGEIPEQPELCRAVEKLADPIHRGEWREAVLLGRSLTPTK